MGLDLIGGDVAVDAYFSEHRVDHPQFVLLLGISKLTTFLSLMLWRFNFSFFSG